MHSCAICILAFVSHKTEREVLCIQLLYSLELAMMHDQATEIIWLTPKPLESTVNNIPSKKQAQGLIY